MYNSIKKIYQSLNRCREQKNIFTKQTEQYRIEILTKSIELYTKAITPQEKLKHLIDLVISALETAVHHGFHCFPEAFERVLYCYSQKIMKHNTDTSSSWSKMSLVAPIDNKKNTLVPPLGWREPYLDDFLKLKQTYKGIILLEGPDHTGKTTLANYFRDNYDAHVMHCTWSKELQPRMDDYLTETIISAMLIAKNKLVVIDRAWISEYVYDAVFRQKSKLNSLHTRMHKTFLTSDTSFYPGLFKLIMCLPYDKSDYIDTFDAAKEKREEMYTNMEKVYDAYETLWDGISTFKFNNPHLKYLIGPGLMYNPKCIRYDYNKMNGLHHMARSIIGEFEALQEE